eukprot:TRINITY_DN51076_c0_g2_i1.p1 TRINITY_DN51076_c0_g2~~TRINITY_DN51076_c0_g2_i1.p1  ORF type:complete len:407 (-),score=66.57 TRINITY_DN51076_c0_g2_i1:309-1529(-)
MGRPRTDEEIASRKAKKDAKKKCKAEAAQETEQAVVDGRLSAKRKEGKQVRAVGLAARLNPDNACYDAQLAKLWKTKSKAERKRLLLADKEKREAVACQREEAATSYPWQVDPTDHCETGPEAYMDIAGLLQIIAQRLGKAPGELRIYDPYYCAGAVKRHLKKIGFENVYNECEDFYAVQENGTFPAHDVIVTNPPYSEFPDGGPNHVARLLDFCLANGKPFLLNMPEYIAAAGYYKRRFAEIPSPLLMYPEKRYNFWTPSALTKGGTAREQFDEDLGFKCSRFATFWFVSLAPLLSNAKLLKMVDRGRIPDLATPESKAALEDGASTAADPAERSTTRCFLCRSLDELPEKARRRFVKKRRRVVEENLSPSGGEMQQAAVVDAPVEKAAMKKRKRKHRTVAGGSQ